MPSIAPTADPQRRATRMDKKIGNPDLIIIEAIMLLNARVEPTDKSIPPAMMTKVIPTAITPIIEV